MKDSFILYTEQKAIINKLTDEQAGKLIKAIFEYVSTDKMPELDTVIDLVITPFKIALDKNKEKYQSVVDRNRENGMKGGRPKKPKKPTGLIENPKEPKKADNDNDNEYEYDNDTVVIDGESRVDGLYQSGSCVDEIVKFYEQNIGAITPYEFNLLDSYRVDFSDDIIIYALKLQVEAKASSIKYTKAILNNWKKKNIKTLLDAKNENEKKKINTEKAQNIYHSNDEQYQDLNKFYLN